mmetsp:Transcript_40322/g.106958  ORF Transcript_40322/g.106958 Transcript_40322/m.106958 type:complete len:327 (-) Transcript_40322:36-1016(-)
MQFNHLKYGTLEHRPDQQERPQRTVLDPQVRFEKRSFVFLGIFALALLWFLPVWDTIWMVKSYNFTYWLGSRLPMWIMSVAVATIIVFFFVAETRFARWASIPHRITTQQTLVTVLTVFITCMGLVLILTSMPLSTKALKASNSLVYECQYSTLTRPTYLVYMELLALRETEDCAARFSIEDCSGFKLSAEVEYLRYMEGNLACSGFCWTSPDVSTAQTAATVSNRTSYLQVDHGHFLESREAVEEEHSLAFDAASMISTKDANVYPTTLFSNANFKTSCEGAASRNLTLLARDVAQLWWYLGMSLIVLSVFMAFSKWTGSVGDLM